MRETRITKLNRVDEKKGAYVLYWMQNALRSEENFALDYAIQEADALGLPVLVLFCVVETLRDMSILHFRRLFAALDELRSALRAKGMRLAIAKGDPVPLVPQAAQQAALVVTDGGYLRHNRVWSTAIASKLTCPMVGVDTNVVFPPSFASSKEEWSAYTLRRRVQNQLDDFLEDCENPVPRIDASRLELPEEFCVDLDELNKNPPGLIPSRIREQNPREFPGRNAALDRFEFFLSTTLDRYDRDKNNPTLEGSSRMSEALNLGLVSPVELVRGVLHTLGEPSAVHCRHGGAAAFIEELVIRRELAINFTNYRDDYDDIRCLPDWANKTLSAATQDAREGHYTPQELEYAATEDPYWNAAQDQMVLTGRMHGYMRMYWGKRLLAWTATPKEAWNMAVELNNRYSLDGRDPNGYAGIAWCFGKHDRPWTGRAIYGSVRYMNAAGLRRKFDVNGYVAQIKRLKEE